MDHGLGRDSSGSGGGGMGGRWELGVGLEEGQRKEKGGGQ